MRKIIAAICMASICLAAFQPSPGFIVTGKISDATCNPVPFASVSVKGTTQTVNADINGTFFIKVPRKNAVLEVKALAYRTVTIKADYQKGITVQLIKLTQEDLKKTGSSDHPQPGQKPGSK